MMPPDVAGLRDCYGRIFTDHPHLYCPHAGTNPLGTKFDPDCPDCVADKRPVLPDDYLDWRAAFQKLSGQFIHVSLNHRCLSFPDDTPADEFLPFMRALYPDKVYVPTPEDYHA